MKVFLSLILAVMLTACGGGGSYGNSYPQVADPEFVGPPYIPSSYEETQSYPASRPLASAAERTEVHPYVRPLAPSPEYENFPPR